MALAPDPVLPPDPCADAGPWALTATDEELVAELECSLWSAVSGEGRAGWDPVDGARAGAGWPSEGLPEGPPEGLLDDTAPGPVLAGLLAAVDLECCPDGQLVEVAAGAVRVQSWAAAVEHSATAVLLRRARRWRGCAAPDRVVPGRTVSADRVVAQELAAALGISGRAATNRVQLATALAELPALREALRAGRVDLWTARTLTEVLAVLDPDQAQRVAARVLGGDPDRCGAQLVAAARRGVLAVDPAAAQARHQRAVDQRSVAPFPLPDGMAGLSYVDTAEKVQSLHTWLTGLAETARAGDPPEARRSLDQARADVLADLASHGLAAMDLPTRQGRRPQLQVLVSAATLLGLDQAPGELAGYGPIPATLAREIAADATWRRILTDPRTGRFDELSEDSYQPSQALRAHVIARDRTCRGPGCRLPADRCDLDHRVPHPRGPTSADNLYPACRPFHETKTLTDTTVTDDGAGGLHVRFPTGRRYHLPADPLLEPAHHAPHDAHHDDGPEDDDRHDQDDGLDVPPY